MLSDPSTSYVGRGITGAALGLLDFNTGDSITKSSPSGRVSSLLMKLLHCNGSEHSLVVNFPQLLCHQLPNALSKEGTECSGSIIFGTSICPLGAAVVLIAALPPLMRH